MYDIYLTYIYFHVTEINSKIASAPPGSPLYTLPLVEDPNNEIAEI
jgi:hypothetical protein